MLLLEEDDGDDDGGDDDDDGEDEVKGVGRRWLFGPLLKWPDPLLRERFDLRPSGRLV